MAKTFFGYRRAQGRAGVRNWIAVISVMDNCNPVTRAISQAVAGTIPVTAMVVRGQFGTDLDFALGALAGRGRNPNIAGVLVVGLEPESTEAVAAHIRPSQPAPDNKRGGLTTVEEKALGALAKSGSSALVGVLGYGQAPVRAGLHFMDAPSAAVENLTAFAIGGCQLTCFGTGVGNPIGNTIAPTIKICGNSNTLRTMRDNIDVDVSAIFESSARIADLG